MDNKVTKRLSNDKRYERPEKTYQDNLSNQDIKDKLKDYKSKLQTKPNEIRNYDFYQKVLDWAKEELAGKTIKELLRTIIKEKIVVIKNSDSKETKNEGDKLVAGNIVYSGQNFNNLNKENISRFINKEGYKESYSGKAMYVTNNIPYAFYYCHLRFALEGKSVSDTLFPTIYKITLKPGTEFFYKGDTNIDKEESKSALICGVSGFHSGNDIVNNQSVEISLFNSDCIENIEAIKPNELITYLDSPEFTKDNNWVRGSYKINENDINITLNLGKEKANKENLDLINYRTINLWLNQGPCNKVTYLDQTDSIIQNILTEFEQNYIQSKRETFNLDKTTFEKLSVLKYLF